MPAALAELPGVAEVRGRGLMLAFDLAGGGAPELVRRALLEQRLVLNATGPATIRLLPPLTIGAGEVDEALAAAANAAHLTPTTAGPPERARGRTCVC